MICVKPGASLQILWEPIHKLAVKSNQDKTGSLQPNGREMWLLLSGCIGSAFRSVPHVVSAHAGKQAPVLGAKVTYPTGRTPFSHFVRQNSTLKSQIGISVVCFLTPFSVS